jgi:hypothetical protein
MSSPTNSKSPLILYLLCLTQINHRYLPTTINKKVGRLYIPINITSLMKIQHYQANLTDNQTSHFPIQIPRHF